MQRVKVMYHLKMASCILIMSSIQLIIGCMYSFLPNLLSELRNPVSTIHLTIEEESWITSIPVLLCPVSIPILGILMDKIGRKRALQASLIPLIASWVIIMYPNSYQSILISRLILGFSFGSLSCEYVYIAEVCPPDIRPIYNSSVSLFVGLGMFLGSWFALYYDCLTMSYMMCIVSVMCFIALCAVPESPMWLRSRGRAKEAWDIDRWFNPERLGAATAPDDNRLAGNNQQVATNNVPAVPSERYWSLFLDRTVWAPTLISLAYFVCQQGSGVYVLLFYSTDVLRDRNDTWSNVAIVAIYLGAARVVGGLCFAMLFRVRRRMLSILSSVGMTVSLFVVIVYRKTFADVENPPFACTQIVTFVLYMFFALLGCLPLPWILIGEIFPMRVKGVMNGVMQSCGYLLLFVALKLYPSLVLNYGMENVWTMYAVFCLLNVLFSIFVMPETNGKSLDEVQSYFESAKRKNIKNNITP